MNEIDVFRRFNRQYTRFIGTLEEGLLHTEFTLAEARLIYEIATRKTSKAREIAGDLGMDPGYLSRLLSKLERGGFVSRTASQDDSRSVDLMVTDKGRAAFEKLDGLSQDQGRAKLEPLPPSERAELARSMRSIERILMKPAAPVHILRPHRVGDMGWVVYREATVYAETYGWDASFEALVAQIAGDFLTNFNPQRERGWMAEVDGANVGHIFLVRHPDEPDTAKLRLLFVEPTARGLGLGRALVNECVREARSLGYRKITLWTQSVLSSARRIYEGAGFRLVREEPHHSFGHHLIGQTWELDLL